MENGNESIEISKLVKFSDVSKLFEKILKSQIHAKKCDTLKGFIESFHKFSIDFKEKNGPNANFSFYSILRLLLPQSDRERESYGIRTSTMGKLYVRVLAVDPHSDVAKKLTTIQGLDKKYLDYADVVYDVMKQRCTKTEGTLTVFDVNQHLTEISNCYQKNRRQKIDDELISMIQGMSAIDQKWLIRIILKNLRLGLGKQKIFSIYHPLAYEFYCQYSNLSKVCDCIENGEELPNIGAVEPFQPVRAMLCQRINIGNLQNLLNEKEYYLETKMDGERFQMHIKDEEYRYFSRNSYEYTNEFGNNNTTGTLTPFLPKLFKRKFINAIFDGEMMVWNKEEQIYHTKGENYDVKNLRTNHLTLRPAFCVYDIIYLDNVSLTTKPYGERRRLLETLITEKEGFLTICKCVIIRNSEDILKYLNEAIDNKEEGVVIKDSESHYKPGERNGGWCKIKPDYVSGLISDFDLIIIGGYYNRRRTYIDSYLMGVFKKDGDNMDSGKFYACCHVSLGLSYAQRIDINVKLRSHWQNVIVIKEGRRNVSSNPPNMEWGSASPDVWIEPKHSIILEIKASELVKTNSFRTNYTLRFPRIVSVRADKMWYDCCTLEEFEKFCSSDSKVEKITKRYITSNDINGPTTSKQFKKGDKPIVNRVTTSILKIEENDQKIDNICEGLDFCILSGSKTKTIAQLKELVLKHGGRIVENPSSKTFVCIAGIINFKVKSLIEKQTYNIADVTWLLNALDGNEPKTELLEFHPLRMLSVTIDLQTEFFQKFDAYGNSYTNPINTEELLEIFTKMEEKNIPTLTKREIHEIEIELLQETNYDSRNYFRLFNGHFYVVNTNVKIKYNKNSLFNLSQYVFEFHGGTKFNIINSDDCDVEKLTHIIMSERELNEEQLNEFMKIFDKNMLKHTKIVHYEWILDCSKNQQQMNIDNYIVNI